MKNIKELYIKDNFLFIDNKKLPTSINEFVGEIFKITKEHIYLDIYEINDYCIEKDFKKLKGIPNTEYEKLKIKRSIDYSFSDLKVKDVIKIQTIIVLEKDKINENGEFNVLKNKTLRYKKFK